MLRHILIAIGIALGATIVAGAGLYLYQTPTTLRVAVVGPGSEDERLVNAIGLRLSADNTPLRLKVLLRGNPMLAAAALDGGEADLALIRSDLMVPGSARAVAIFRRNVVVLIAPPDGAVKRIADLPGKTIGVVGRAGSNDAILETILEHHHIPTTAVRSVAVEIPDVREVARARLVDAVLTVGAPNARAITEAIEAFAEGTKSPTFLAIENAAGIAKRKAAFEAAEIVAGSFGGNRPAETMTTLGFQTYLVARQGLRESTVTEFTRLLFNLRPSLAIDLPSANRIEAPDTEIDARLPVHAGAAAYLDGQERSFFEAYGDWLYYGLAAFGLLGSAFAWLARQLRAGASTPNNQVFERIGEMPAQVRAAATIDRLNELEREVDAIFADAMHKSAGKALDGTEFMTFSLVLDYVRQAIADRRRGLEAVAGAGAGHPGEVTGLRPATLTRTAAKTRRLPERA